MMFKFNAQNERIKRQYFEWEKEACGKHSSTIDNMRDALYSFEEFIGFKDFKLVDKKDIIAFKKQLQNKKNIRTGNPISKKYLLQISHHLIDFFQWLCSQAGYKKRPHRTDIAYFNPSAKDIQTAYAAVSKRYPTIEQIEHIVRNMPSETDVQKRNRALMAFLALTGCRISAIASLRLKHVFLDDERIEQNPNEVNTKGSKRIITYLFPVSDFLTNVFKEWVQFLEQQKLYDFNAPLFPANKLGFDEKAHFKREELDSVPWRSGTSIRNIVQEAFKSVRLNYCNPHSFRNTLAHLLYKHCKTPEETKAWSQNLGHSSVFTTFTSYGTIDEYTQGIIIKRLGKNTQ